MNPALFEVAAVGPAEAAEVVALLAEATAWLAARGLPAWAPGTLAEVVREIVARHEVFVARRAGRAVATVSVYWRDETFWGVQPDDAGYVHKLAVARAAAGGGLGRALLAWAERHIAARGKRWVRLDCHARNDAINAYYRAAGYAACGAIELAGEHFNLYQKPLA